jgi:hypothetical protein
MAQTNPSPRRGASSSGSRSRSTTRSSRSRSTGRSSRPGSATRSKSSAAKKPSSRARRGTRAPSTRPTNGRGTLESVTDTVSSGAQNTAQGVAGAIKKGKTPLIAGGAAIAGLAGAAALKARSRRRRVLGVTLPRRNPLRQIKEVDARKIPGAVSDAATRADRFGQRVSSVAKTVQTVSGTADRAKRT